MWSAWLTAELANKMPPPVECKQKLPPPVEGKPTPPAPVQGPAVRSALDGGRKWSDVAACDGADAEPTRTRGARGPWWTAPRLPERMRAAGARATIFAARRREGEPDYRPQRLRPRPHEARGPARGGCAMDESG